MKMSRECGSISLNNCRTKYRFSNIKKNGKCFRSPIYIDPGYRAVVFENEMSHRFNIKIKNISLLLFTKTKRNIKINIWSTKKGLPL